MPPSTASDSDAPPEPTPPEASPDQTPDGDTPSTGSKPSKSSRSSGGVLDEAAPRPYAQQSGANWRVLTVESERLGPRSWARLGLYAVVIVLGASLAGYLVGNLGGTVRAARSEVLYQLAADQPSGNLRQDRQLSTQLVAMRSRDVLDPVAKRNGLTRQELADKLRVGVVGDSEVIGLEVQDPSASRARALIDETTGEYLAHVPSNGATAARQYLEGQAADLDQRLQQLTAQLAALPPTASAQQAPITAEMQSLFTQRGQVDSRLQDVTVEELRQPLVKQITKGYVVADPVSPRPWRGAAIGALVGLLVAAIAIAVLVRRRMSAPGT